MKIKNKIYEYFYQIRQIVWIIPGIFTLLSFFVFYLFTVKDLDFTLLQFIHYYNWDGMIGNSAASLVAHASTLAVTIFALSISLTMIVLTLASSQLGPRIIEYFLGNQRTQFVMGYYVACIVFLLLIDARIGPDTDPGYVPILALIFAYTLALFSPLIMIFFISHLGYSIKSDNVARGLAKLLEQSIRLYCETNSENSSGRSLKVDENKKKHLISTLSGHLYNVKSEKIVSLLSEHNSFLVLKYSPGDYIIKGQVIAELYGQSLDDEDFIVKILDNLSFGNLPVQTEDVDYFLRRIVEIALRALSPGINDPYTANACLNYMFSSIQPAALSNKLPKGLICDEDNTPRLQVKRVSLEEMYELAIDPIRQASKTTTLIHYHILNLIKSVLSADINQDAKKALKRHASVIIKDLNEFSEFYIKEKKLEEYEKYFEEI